MTTEQAQARLRKLSAQRREQVKASNRRLINTQAPSADEAESFDRAYVR